MEMKPEKSNKKPINTRLEELVDDMLDVSIRLNEAKDEFERIFIDRALERNGSHISKTAKMIGIHRNTISKRISGKD